MCKVCEESLKIMYYNYCVLLICVHTVPLNITGIGGEPTVLERENLQLICIESSRIKHHLDQIGAWEPRIYWCGTRREGADYNKHQQD